MTRIRDPEVTYEIVEGGLAIRCLCCGMTSYNPNDIKFRYCGRCGIYHEDRMLERLIRRMRRERGETDDAR